MISRLFSVAAIFGVIAVVFLTIGGDRREPAEGLDKQADIQNMTQAGSPMSSFTTGFSYSPELAPKFGLPAEEATDMQSPLLGLALQIEPGVRGGNICVLHIMFDSAADIRLPADHEMHAIGANVGVFPNGFMQRPDSEIRRHIADRDGALAHRAMFRNGRNELTEGATAGDDSNGSYTSMPLHGYNREFVPGVGWLAMMINCELAAHDDYSHASLFAESNLSPSDMIANLHVDPSKMIEFKFPAAFLPGMRSMLQAAVDESMDMNQHPVESRFTIIR